MSEATTSNSDNYSTNENLILELSKGKPDGISEQDIKQNHPNMTIKEYTAILNKFLKKGILTLLKDKKSQQLLYKFNGETLKTTALKGADSEEKVVFSIITEAGNKGIWIREIREKSNLSQMQIRKIIKVMESKGLIKSVKPVNQSKKIVYMLYHLTPDNTITGGTWYHNQTYENEFVEVLSQQCLRYLNKKLEDAVSAGGGPLIIKNNSYASVNDVVKFISDIGISKVPLSAEDIECILYVLVLDNHAEKTVATNGAHLYRTTKHFLPTQGLFKIYCGACPISNKCNDEGEVNPNSCKYMDEWLS